MLLTYAVPSLGYVWRKVRCLHLTVFVTFGLCDLDTRFFTTAMFLHMQMRKPRNLQNYFQMRLHYCDSIRENLSNVNVQSYF